ncbi:MAG: fibronectin/fibrinogen-binding protein, partial [Acutalibacteraceae bacterium]|nr:fibronectin/fibrinogen-binding protein [Acutalibacteraceae bacterium]
SHVILFTEGKEVDDETLLYAANLAAYFSKAKNGGQVSVDYTPVKFVKKPNGAKPGMVIYSTNKTIYANPGDFKL